MDTLLPAPPAEPAFDWSGFLNGLAETRTEEQWREADRMAYHWPSCACGFVCHGTTLKRLPGGAPADKTMRNLGADFSDAIFRRDVYKARTILLMVQDRATFLLSDTSKPADSLS